MDDWKKYLDSDDLTPEDNAKRVVEILSEGCLRSIKEQKENPTSATPQKPNLGFYPKPGVIPFGYTWSDKGIVKNESEMLWVRRIVELGSFGLSSEKIARQLNKEDHLTRRRGKWTRTAVWRILKKHRDASETE